MTINCYTQFTKVTEFANEKGIKVACAYDGEGGIYDFTFFKRNTFEGLEPFKRWLVLESCNKSIDSQIDEMLSFLTLILDGEEPFTDEFESFEVKPTYTHHIYYINGDTYDDYGSVVNYVTSNGVHEMVLADGAKIIIPLNNVLKIGIKKN